MLIRLVNRLTGYVVFECRCESAEKFINTCRKMRINIKNIRAEGGVLTARCAASEYKKLRPAARLCGARLRIIAKRGLPFLLLPLKNRWGVFCGLLLFVFTVSFMGGFIWNITVSGADGELCGAVVDFLAHSGFETGVRWADTDKENLEFAVMAEFDEVAWISINRSGCSADIELREATAKPSISDTEKITNVVARRDGVIVKVTALGGWSAVKSGEAVVKGDLLISGVYEPDEYENMQKNHFAHAHGTVIAETRREITVHIPRAQSEKRQTAEEKFVTLCFFGLEIPLYAPKKAAQNSVSEYEKEYLELNKNRLPIGKITETRREYKAVKYSAGDDELRRAAEAALLSREKEELGGCKIIGKSEKEELDESGLTLTASYSLLEDIGEERDINFKP